MYCTIFFVIVCLFINAAVASREIVVTTNQGRIRGSVEYSYNGTKYYAFHTIRYAKAPVGDLRFQAPQPADPWTNTFNATVPNGAICYQVSFDLPNETEDCLFLSVYSPNIWADELLPVIFHIHGGGFYFGWADIYRPGYFMDSAKVVVVNVNYRLGPFGFFSTGDGIIPGNAGLKDQLLALQWTQKNIASFGGDPNKVTLMGESAGANSVDYHILSSRSAGLFRAAVLLSGTAINSLPCLRDQTSITYDTAKLIGNAEFQNIKNSSQLLSKLQKVSARQIDMASKAYKDSFDQNRIVKLAELQVAYYAPVIEKHNNEPFVTRCPYESFHNGNYNKVPVFLGTVNEEGLIVMLDNYLWMLDEFDKNISLLVPAAMGVKNPNALQTIGQLIKQEYSPTSRFQNNHLGAVRFYSDVGFHMPIMTRAFTGALKTPVYIYVFTYEGQKESFHVTVPGAGNVMHSEDFGYPWQFDNSANFTNQDKLMKDRMITLLTNFVTYLDPTPNRNNLLQNIKWPTVGSNNFRYLDLGANLSVKKNFKMENYQFWKNLFKLYKTDRY
ncbi:esterase FE4-like isoform X1 [Cylas formicarius]|uniref:esterase FE4-like isoform X1 n=1 Tax=Cylas formicarius TaxID=197179 RepID=UPI00295869E4|nr:esterase FE4-like isoform X1 [Cylas formicarius]